MLKEKILQNLNAALKEKKELEVSVLRLINAAIFNKEKEKRYKIACSHTILKEAKAPYSKISKTKPELNLETLTKESKESKQLEKESALTDDEITEVISAEIKKGKEAVALFGQGKREDLVKKGTAEIEILTQYLPEQLSEENIKGLVREAIAKVGAKEMRDFGKVMQELMPQVKGKADGTLVSKIVKDLLAVPSEKND